MAKRPKKKTRAMKIAESEAAKKQQQQQAAPPPPPKEVSASQSSILPAKKEKSSGAKESKPDAGKYFLGRNTTRTPTGLTGEEKHLDSYLGAKAAMFSADLEVKKTAAKVAALCQTDRVVHAINERREREEMKKKDKEAFVAAGLGTGAKKEKKPKIKESGSFKFSLPKISIHVERPEKPAAPQAKAAEPKGGKKDKAKKGHGSTSLNLIGGIIPNLAGSQASINSPVNIPSRDGGPTPKASKKSGKKKR